MWTDEETPAFQELVHQTNGKVILDGNSDHEPRAISLTAPSSAAVVVQHLTVPKNKKIKRTLSTAYLVQPTPHKRTAAVNGNTNLPSLWSNL